MKVEHLAEAFAIRLNEVLPSGFRATAHDEEVRIITPTGFRAGAWVGGVAFGQDAVDGYRTAAWNVLCAAQDAVSEATAMPWPRVLGPALDLALPASRIDGRELQMWYGDESSPALRLAPIVLDELNGRVDR
jgi:hypothetical protein